MVQTTTETLTVNGVVLNTLAKNISSLAGRLRAPAYRTGNVVVPGSHGELWVPNKKFQANTITFPMWVVGCDDDGEIPGGSNRRKEFFKRVDELVTLFKSPNLLDIVWTTARDETRRCWAEALDVLDFTTDASPKGMVGVVLTIPGSFWEDTTTKTQTLTGTGTTLTPTNFQGGSAPMENLVYTIKGPWTNPRATFSDGSWFQYSAALTSAHTLTVDSGEWELTGAGGLVADYSKISHDGADSVWGALPASAAAITLSGSARTTASAFTITGKRKFLVG